MLSLNLDVNSKIPAKNNRIDFLRYLLCLFFYSFNKNERR